MTRLRTDRASVSVVIPVYNGVRHLGDALASVLAQTRPAQEVIVVDDGSTDGSAVLLRDRFPTVRCLRQDNAGAGAARNRGVAAATGDFLAFLDADDLWEPDKLQRQLAAFAADPGLEMVLCRVRQFHCPELTGEERRRRAIPREVMPGYLPGAMLVRRPAFLRVGPFNPELRIGEFVDWHARAVELGLNRRQLPEVLLLRRLHRSNLGLVARDQRRGYLHALKASLDRRRSKPS